MSSVVLPFAVLGNFVDVGFVIASSMYTPARLETKHETRMQNTPHTPVESIFMTSSLPETEIVLLDTVLLFAFKMIECVFSW